MDLLTSYIYENECEEKEIAECEKTNKQMDWFNFIYIWKWKWEKRNSWIKKNE